MGKMTKDEFDKGGGWGAFDPKEKRLSGQLFKRPVQVGKYFLAEIQSGRLALEEHNGK